MILLRVLLIRIGNSWITYLFAQDLLVLPCLEELVLLSDILMRFAVVIAEIGGANLIRASHVLQLLEKR